MMRVQSVLTAPALDKKTDDHRKKDDLDYHANFANHTFYFHETHGMFEKQSNSLLNGWKICQVRLMSAKFLVENINNKFNVDLHAMGT